MSGSRRFRAGALAGLLSQVLNVAGRLALVPLFLAAWGDVAYGEWLTLSAAVAYLSMIDLGVQNHVVNELCKAWTAGRRERYRQVLHTALKGSLVASVVVLGAVALALWLAPLSTWLDVRVHSPDSTRGIAVLLACQVTIAVPLGVLIGVYRTVGEYGRGVMVENARTLGLLAGTGAVLAAGGDPIAVAAIQLAPLAATSVFVVLDLRRRHPEVPIGLSGFDLRVASSLIAPSLYFLVIQGALLCTLQGSTVAVQLLFGGAAVTLFCTLRTLANLVRQIANSLGNALWPQATELYVKGERQRLREIHRLAGKLTLAATATAAVHLWLLGPEILRIWTDGAIDADPALLQSFVVLLVGQGMWSTSAVYLMAWGRQRAVAVPMLYASLAGLIAGVLAAQRFGLPGMVWGIGSLELLICGVAIPMVVCRELGEAPSRHLWELVGRGALPIATVGVVGFWLAPLVPADGWIRIATVTAALSPLAAWLTYRTWLDDGERDRVRRLVGLRSRPALAVQG